MIQSASVATVTQGTPGLNHEHSESDANCIICIVTGLLVQGSSQKPNPATAGSSARVRFTSVSRVRFWPVGSRGGFIIENSYIFAVASLEYRIYNY